MIEQTQTCDRCGKSRKYDPRRSEAGGWRRLGHGSIEADFCNRCITVIVDDALARATVRAEAAEAAARDA